jgi:hypothetical protein
MSVRLAISEHVSPRYILSGKTLPQEHTCKAIVIEGSYSIMKFDDNHFKNNVLDNIFKEGSCRKFCDYFIVSDNLVLICEMKSNNTSGANKQLHNGKVFFDYLINVVRRYTNIPLNPTIKFVTFSNKGNKPTTKPSQKLNSETWDGYEKFHLKCGTTYYLQQF